LQTKTNKKAALWHRNRAMPFMAYVAFGHVQFGRQKFSFQCINGTKNLRQNRCQKMESIYGAGFWSVCHGYKTKVIEFDKSREIDFVASVDRTLIASQIS